MPKYALKMDDYCSSNSGRWNWGSHSKNCWAWQGRGEKETESDRKTAREIYKTIVYKCIIYCYNIISFWSCFFIITDECDIIYLCKYIQIKFISHTHALWMEYIRLLRTGIMSEYPVMSTSQGSYVRIKQTSEAIRVTYEMCRAECARTGIENRCY